MVRDTSVLNIGARVGGVLGIGARDGAPMAIGAHEAAPCLTFAGDPLAIMTEDAFDILDETGVALLPE